MNGAGQVFGRWDHCDDPPCYAPAAYSTNFIYTNGVLTTLPDDNGALVEPVASRSLNQLLCYTESATPEMCLYNNGKYTNRGPGIPTGMNDNGAIIGADTKGKFVEYSVGHKTRLGSPANASHCGFTAINDKNWIVGVCAIRTGLDTTNNRVTLWEPNKAPVLLNSLLPAGFTKLSGATTINANNQILANGILPNRSGTSYILQP